MALFPNQNCNGQRPDAVDAVTIDCKLAGPRVRRRVQAEIASAGVRRLPVKKQINCISTEASLDPFESHSVIGCFSA
jgi:hypothetical protein